MTFPVKNTWNDDAGDPDNTMSAQDQNDLANAVNAVKVTADAKYTKPPGGIPSSDLAAGLGGGAVDAASVDAAGAVMNTDTSTAAMGFVLDEDNMASNSATKVCTQQSLRAFVLAQIAAAEFEPGVAVPSYTTNVGDGTANPVVITHGMGTRALTVTLVENGGDYEVGVICKPTAPTPDVVVLYHDDVWATNEFTACIMWAGQTDVDPPTAPTLVEDSTTADSVTVTASGSTDDTGVAHYEIYRDGSVVGTTATGTFTDTGLDGGTDYDYTARAYDIAGNPSPISNIVPSTTGSSAVTFAAVSSGATNLTAATNISVVDSIALTAGQRLVAVVMVTHASFFSNETYTTRACTSNLDGALTLVESVNIGNSASIHLFDLDVSTTGTHTLTANFVHANSTACIRLGIAVLNDVGSRGTPGTEGATSGSTNITLDTTDFTSLVLFAGGYANSPTAFSGTQRLLFGSTVTGNGDFMLIGTAPGSTGTVTFTASNSSAHSEILVEYKV